jgi:hypothetical protein
MEGLLEGHFMARRGDIIIPPGDIATKSYTYGVGKG